MYLILSAFFESLGVKSFMVDSKKGITTFKVKGIKAVSPLIPLFVDNLGLGYWKTNNINMLIEFFKYHSAGAQTYKKGLIALLNLLYKYLNNSSKSLSECI